MFVQLNPSSKKRLYKLTASCTFVLLAGLLYYLFVSNTGWKIPCLFYTLTGLYCPGCGVTRMAVALLQFDFARAFHYHPVLLCTLFPLGICFGVQALRYVKTGETKFSRWQNVVMWIVIAALILFCACRNWDIVFG